MKRPAHETEENMVQPIDTAERASRLARYIAQEISLYNEDKVLRGVTEDRFFTELAVELDEGRDLYRTRVSAELYAQTNYFDRAIVDVILKARALVPSKIW